MLTQAAILVEARESRPGDHARAPPAALSKLGGRVFLDILLDEIARYGCLERVLLLAGEAGETVAQWHGAQPRENPRIDFMRGTSAAGAGGALTRALDRLDRRFLLLDGASFFDINLLDLVTTAGESLVHVALRPGLPGQHDGPLIGTSEGSAL